MISQISMQKKVVANKMIVVFVCVLSDQVTYVLIICPGKELGQCLDYNECTVSFGVDINYFCWQQWQWCSATIQACLWMRHKILASVQNLCFSDSFDDTLSKKLLLLFLKKETNLQDSRFMEETLAYCGQNTTCSNK